MTYAIFLVYMLILSNLLVILGADAVPYGPSVVRDLQRNGYIVLASVFSGEAADDLERDTEGYVRALVLDPEEVRASLSKPESCGS